MKYVVYLINNSIVFKFEIYYICNIGWYYLINLLFLKYVVVWVLFIMLIVIFIFNVLL